MHSRLYITMNATEQEEALYLAREYMDAHSEHDDAIEDGFHDWYVIGGRWSMDLVRGYEWGRKYWELAEQYKQEEELPYFAYFGNSEESRANAAKQERIYEKLGVYWRENVQPPFSPDVHPMTTDQYNEDGVQGDVAQIDESIYQRLIEQKFTGSENRDEYGDPYFIDLDGDAVSDKEKYVGKKWIVVIDYHN